MRLRRGGGVARLVLALAQLADWEADYKRKRAENLRDPTKGGAGGAQAQKTSGWAAVKKSVAQSTTAASLAAQAKSREQLASIPAAYETDAQPKTARKSAEPAGGA